MMSYSGFQQHPSDLLNIASISAMSPVFELLETQSSKCSEQKTELIISAPLNNNNRLT